MGHIVIGIHGLSNKPAADVLEKGWKDAMIEGLQKNIDNHIKHEHLNFTSVYWAGEFHDDPDPDPDLYYPAAE